MSISAFNDKKLEPTKTEIDAIIGAKLSIWNDLLGYILVTYNPEKDLKFLYGKNYGWGYRFRVKGRLLTALYPTNGGFTVQLILNPEAVETARFISIGQNVQKAIDEANPYPEGRWLFIHVENKVDLEDIYRLLELKTRKK